MILRTIALAGIIALPAAAWCVPGRAHDAPTGWSYDASCCSNRDCAPVPEGRVTAGPDGWHVDLRPGDHPAITHPFSAVVPYDSPKIRRSQDGAFHPCIGAIGGVTFCLYTPDMGM